MVVAEADVVDLEAVAVALANPSATIAAVMDILRVNAPRVEVAEVAVDVEEAGAMIEGEVEAVVANATTAEAMAILRANVAKVVAEIAVIVEAVIAMTAVVAEDVAVTANATIATDMATSRANALRGEAVDAVEVVAEAVAVIANAIIARRPGI
jgi:hypothetical protein